MKADELLAKFAASSEMRQSLEELDKLRLEIKSPTRGTRCYATLELGGKPTVVSLGIVIGEEDEPETDYELAAQRPRIS